MINLVVDTQNIFYRSMFMVGSYGAGPCSFDSQDEVDKLIRKVSTDVTYILRTLTPNRVIFTYDNKSWRKSINIEENEGYKGNRKQSEFMNWTNIYNAIDTFSGLMDSNGFINSKVDKAEADDLMALWIFKTIPSTLLKVLRSTSTFSRSRQACYNTRPTSTCCLVRCR